MPRTRLLSDAGTHASPPRTCGPGLPFSLCNFLLSGHIELLIGNEPLEAGVLFLQFLEPLQGVHLRAGILAVTTLVSRHAHRNNPAGFLHGFAAGRGTYSHPQLLDDLLWCLSFSFDESRWRSRAGILTTHEPVLGEHSTNRHQPILMIQGTLPLHLIYFNI